MKSERVLKHSLKRGITGTITKYSGFSTCPCTSVTGEYDPVWHSRNLLSEDCEGSGKIGKVETEYSIKCFFSLYDESLSSIAGKLDFEKIGITDSDIYIMLNPVLISTKTKFDLSGISNYLDFFSYDSKNYWFIRTVISAHFQAGVLKEVNKNW